MDLVSTAVKMPASGETVLGSGFQMHPGGKGANQAVAVSRLGYPVHMIGKLGSDLFGQQLRAHLQSVGVGLMGVETVEGASGIAAVIVAPTGENRIVVTPGVNAAVSPEYMESYTSLICSASLVLAQLEIPIETVERLAELCLQEGVPLMLDPAPAQALSPSLLRRISWFTPNETEAAFYLHREIDSLDEGFLCQTASSLLAQGPTGIVLKLGSRGAYLSANGINQRLSAIAVDVIDTTAAGDALNGAFAVGLVLGKSPSESARFAVAAASVSVTRQGAQSSMPTFAEVARMLDDKQ